MKIFSLKYNYFSHILDLFSGINHYSTFHKLPAYLNVNFVKHPYQEQQRPIHLPNTI